MDQLSSHRLSFRSASPDELAEFWRTALGWQVVFDRTGCAAGETRLEWATLGGLSTGRQRFNLGYSWSFEAADSYVAWLTTRGSSVYQRGREQYVGGPNDLLAYAPGVLRRVAKVDADSDLTYLALEPRVLERHLERLLECPVSGTIELAPTAKLRPGVGQGWWSMLQLLNAMLLSPDSRLVLPAVVDPLCEAMMTSLLLTVDHQYRDALARPAAPCQPRHVRRAIEAIHAHPEHPYTVSALADVAGVSIRTLQQGFRAHLDTAPMAYLRHVRLACAHEELRHDDTVGVAEVAFRWGFTHLGRFAAAYARQYGILPSRTGHRGTACDDPPRGPRPGGAVHGAGCGAGPPPIALAQLRTGRGDHRGKAPHPDPAARALQR